MKAGRIDKAARQQISKTLITFYPATDTNYTTLPEKNKSQIPHNDMKHLS